MSRPLITALIDTYNHERYIEQAVTSALEQGLSPAEVEVLIVDDGSTDGTPDVLRRFGQRIRCLRKQNGGQASAFNAAIPEAQGRIVAFLDGDDWWAPDKLREVAEVFEKNRDLGAVGHGYYEVNSDAAAFEIVVPKGVYRLLLNDVADAHLFNSLADLLATSKLAVRKDVLERMLPLPEEFIFIADAFVYTLAVASAGAIVLDQPLCYYRVHAENLFATTNPVRARRKQELQRRFMDVMTPRLSALGMPREVITTVLEPLWLETERVHLTRNGGEPWRTFRVERAAYRTSCGDASFGDRLFHALVLGLTLLMPPQRFYRLKQWYSERGLRRFRGTVGNPMPPDRVLLRRRFASIDSRQSELKNSASNGE